MANAVPQTGLGITFSMESATPGTYTALADIVDIPEEPEWKMGLGDTTDYSHTDGVRRKGLALMIEMGSCTIKIKYDGKSTTYTTLKTQADTRTAKNYKFTYPNGVTRIVNAFITNIKKSTPIDEMNTAEFEFTPTGAVTEAVS